MKKKRLKSHCKSSKLNPHGNARANSGTYKCGMRIPRTTTFRILVNRRGWLVADTLASWSLQKYSSVDLNVC